MWFRKPKVQEYVECEGCGCLMKEARKEVEADGPLPDPNASTITFVIFPLSSYTELYCGKCAPPYDMRRGGRFYLKQDIEVTEKGKVIGGKGD